MPKVLVTGAAGFLGYHLASSLADRDGTEVVCVDNFVRGEQDTLYRQLVARRNVSEIAVDLSDPRALDALPEDADYVYHLAALNGTQNFYERPLEVLKCCTLPTMFLAEKYGRLGRLKRFIYAGTSEAYASIVTRFDWPVPTGEDVPLGIDDIFNPRWSYAMGKMHGEVVTAQVGRSFAMPVSIIRYHNAYGPRMGDKHVVPDFYIRAREGRFELYGHQDTRSFIYVADCVRATILAGETPACANEVINIGSEREITIRELGTIMMAAAGLEGTIAAHPSPSGSVKRRAPAIAKLKALTGFAETVSLEEGLKITADYYLNG